MTDAINRQALTIAQKKKNELIRQLYYCFFQISDLQKIDDFTEEDLDLWMKCTRHSSIRERIQSHLDAVKGE